MKYNELVETAKQIMLQIECHQAEIAKLAMEACEIRRGGNDDRKYSLIDFSKDTGIDHGSIKNWVAIYRDVFLKIEKSSPSAQEWKHGSRTHNAMRTLVDDQTAKGRGYKSQLPKEKVSKLFDEVSGGNPEESLAAHQALRYANMIRVTLGKIDLSTQNTQLLSQILNTLVPVTSKVSDHLTKNVKRRA